MPDRSSVALLQRITTLSSLAAAIAWLLWWWPRSPSLALLGALGLAFGFAWVLALEFALLPLVCRGDPAPAARPHELLRAWWAETRSALEVFAWRQPYRWREVPDRLHGERVQGRTGVVFIHGFLCNRGFWTPWLRRVNAQGRAFVAVNLGPPFGETDDYVPTVERPAEAVRAATGRPPLLVCHSMGGLVARAWLRTRRDAHPVAHVISIGSPHRGTWIARFSHLPNGRQMRQDCEWMRDLHAAWDPAQAVRWTCWHSNCDNIVMPPSTATLPGADNCFVPGAAHVDLAFQPQVMEASLALLARCDERTTA
mgnify:CR=1 FL=1